MGNSCGAAESLDQDEAVISQRPATAETWLDIPGAEVLVMGAGAKEGVVTERGNFKLQVFPAGRQETAGLYKVHKDKTAVSASMSLSKDPPIAELDEGSLVNVVEVVMNKQDKRVRGRLEDPDGWISLSIPGTQTRWATKLPVAVLFVGDEFGSTTEEGGGFYYPLTPITPVLLVWETRVLTLSALEGDTFGIRFPLNQVEVEEQLLMLVETLPQFCTFRLEKRKDVADYVAEGAAGLAVAVGYAAEGLAKVIQKSGGAARANLAQKEEVKVSATTKVAVQGAKAATSTSVKVTGQVLDGLLSTAMYIGKEVGKSGASAAGAGGSSSAGHPKPESQTKKVLKATGFGGLQVFDALLKAGDQLSTLTADEAAGVVAHRYGADAGGVAREGLSITGDVLELQKMAGKKAVGKLATKGAMFTAQGVIQGAVEKAQDSNQGAK